MFIKNSYRDMTTFHDLTKMLLSTFLPSYLSAAERPSGS